MLKSGMRVYHRKRKQYGTLVKEDRYYSGKSMWQVSGVKEDAHVLWYEHLIEPATPVSNSESIHLLKKGE